MQIGTQERTFIKDPPAKPRKGYRQIARISAETLEHLLPLHATKDETAIRVGAGIV